MVTSPVSYLIESINGSLFKNVFIQMLGKNIYIHTVFDEKGNHSNNAITVSILKIDVLLCLKLPY